MRSCSAWCFVGVLIALTTAVHAETPKVSPPADVVVAPPADPALGKRVPTFSSDLIDVSADPPRIRKFESAKVTKPTAYIFVGTGCPATNAYAERFHQITDLYRKRGIDFVYLYPNRDDTHEAKIDFHKKKQLGGEFIDDEGGNLARQFGAVRTTEIFVADKSGTIVYHGGLDDSRDSTAVKQHYLADAFDQMLAAKPIAVGYSQVFA